MDQVSKAKLLTDALLYSHATINVHRSPLLERNHAGRVYGRAVTDAFPTYFAIRAADPPEIKKLYSFRTTTSAGSQKNFFIINSLQNSMKSADDMEEIIKQFDVFMAKYTGKNAVFLVGDFYVWKHALQYLWTTANPSPEE